MKFPESAYLKGTRSVLKRNNGLNQGYRLEDEVAGCIKINAPVSTLMTPFDSDQSAKFIDNIVNQNIIGVDIVKKIGGKLAYLLGYDSLIVNIYGKSVQDVYGVSNNVKFYDMSHKKIIQNYIDDKDVFLFSEKDHYDISVDQKSVECPAHNIYIESFDIKIDKSLSKKHEFKPELFKDKEEIFEFLDGFVIKNSNSNYLDIVLPSNITKLDKKLHKGIYKVASFDTTYFSKNSKQAYSTYNYKYKETVPLSIDESIHILKNMFSQKDSPMDVIGLLENFHVSICSDDRFSSVENKTSKQRSSFRHGLDKHKGEISYNLSLTESGYSLFSCYTDYKNSDITFHDKMKLLEVFETNKEIIRSKNSELYRLIKELMIS